MGVNTGVTPPQIILLMLIMFCGGMPGGWLMAHGQFWPGLALSQLLGFAAPLLALALANPQQRAAWFPWRTPTLRELAWLCGLTLCVTVGTEGLVQYAQQTWHLPTLFETNHHAELFAPGLHITLLRILFICLTPALFEESIFRGIVYGSIAHFNTASALWISSTCFALAHGNFWYFPGYLLLGAYLGWLRARGHSLAWPIVAHAVNNFVTLWLHQSP